MPPPINRRKLEQALALTDRGMTQAEIAAEVGMHVRTLQRRLPKLHAAALAELTADLAAVKHQKFQQLEHVRIEALKAWERSKGRSRTVKRKTTPVPQDSGIEAAIESTETTTRKEVGDVRFLAAAMSAIEAQRALLGLDAPKPKGDGDGAPFDWSEAQAKLEARLAAEGPPGPPHDDDDDPPRRGTLDRIADDERLNAAVGKPLDAPRPPDPVPDEPPAPPAPNNPRPPRWPTPDELRRR